MQLNDIIRTLEKVAPPRLADEGDKTGLQVGDASSDISKVIVAVDPTPAVIDHAVDSGSDLLISHHPLIFNPLETLAAGTSVKDSVIKLIKADIALYAMHTNYDSAPGGINDVLADRLGVRVMGLLTTRHREKKLKLAVFTPPEAIDAIRDAMAEAGAGIIGNYTHCSFRSDGMGTFVPLPGSEPYVGEIGRLQEEAEYKLEMIVPEWRLSQVLDTMIEKHPYEEVAYDIYPLENEPYSYGYGRVGRLAKPMKLSEFRQVVEESLESQQIRMIGNQDKPVEVVALCGGGGKRLIPDAFAAGADVYVTGDVGHHDFLDADALGLAVIDAGHYETERPGMELLAAKLSSEYAGESVTVEFIK
ncbi:MAG: Nif3-like dinuclear metal center hexameric protein [Armatimonadota bacterium]